MTTLLHLAAANLALTAVFTEAWHLAPVALTLTAVAAVLGGRRDR